MGWAFWVDEGGNPVRGPIGRYGGPRVFKVGAAAAVLVVLISLVLINPFSFGGGDSDPGARSTLDPAPPGIGQNTEPEETPGGTPTGTPTAGPRSPNETPTETPSPTPTDSGTPTPTPSETATPTPTQPKSPKSSETPGQEATVVFQNCAEARAAGKAPLHRGDPGYSEKLDKNGDGVACEKGNS
ncbi:excalibur calcium-binding domain-containing protein [Kribbella sp. VKM Ac-2527]|uniref:Excalibur calcium-binding domain-containing protein n=2 Tax=Kribbella caucasensis TaxID=2512215 RepID=A0A4R6K5Y4_9ACTN|nr:excalibur calcium-binding domain-containing protein [Kribbella sp. VKM Ac-2527]